MGSSFQKMSWRAAVRVFERPLDWRVAAFARTVTQSQQAILFRMQPGHEECDSTRTWSDAHASSASIMYALTYLLLRAFTTAAGLACRCMQLLPKLSSFAVGGCGSLMALVRSSVLVGERSPSVPALKTNDSTLMQRELGHHKLQCGDKRITHPLPNLGSLWPAGGVRRLLVGGGRLQGEGKRDARRYVIQQYQKGADLLSLLQLFVRRCSSTRK